MYNWAVDLKRLEKSGEKFIIWKLEQMINFGLGKEKLNRRLLKKYWKRLDIDPAKKRYLKSLLWGRKS